MVETRVGRVFDFLNARRFQIFRNHNPRTTISGYLKIFQIEKPLGPRVFWKKKIRFKDSPVPGISKTLNNCWHSWKTRIFGFSKKMRTMVIYIKTGYLIYLITLIIYQNWVFDYLITTVINFDTKKALAAIPNTHLTLVKTGSGRGRGRWGFCQMCCSIWFF